jgi:hypothetical protein
MITIVFECIILLLLVGGVIWKIAYNQGYQDCYKVNFQHEKMDNRNTGNRSD